LIPTAGRRRAGSVILANGSAQPRVVNTDASAWETTAATVPAKLRKAITNAAAALRDNWGFDTQVLLQGVRDGRPGQEA
jgi:hypothetical protein